jgi:hypothetical protein
MHRLVKTLIGGAAGAALIIGTAGIAQSDTIYIDLVTNPGSDDVTLDLADGSPQTATITLEVATANDDNKNGCNLTASGSQVRFDVVVNTVSGTASTLDKSVVTFTDCTTPQTIGVSATAVGVIGVTLTYKDHVSGSSPLTAADWNTAGAAFSVTVIDSTQTGTLDAPEIANAYLSDRLDNSDCKEAFGNNKNKSNWHGQLISAVAQHFQGQTFTNSTKAIVEDYVEDACRP